MLKLLKEIYLLSQHKKVVDNFVGRMDDIYPKNNLGYPLHLEMKIHYLLSKVSLVHH